MPADVLCKTGKATPAYVWGYNNRGLLGLGHSARLFTPVPTTLPAGTVDVQGGTEFSVALTSTGRLYTVGDNRYGQLGDGTTTTRMAWTSVPLPKGTVVTDIEAGSDHVLALTKRGEVFAWGRNHRGQAGIGDAEHTVNPIRVVSGDVIALGAGHGVSAAVTSHGQLLTWGRNGSGQLALESGADVRTPSTALLPKASKVVAVDAGYSHTVVLTRSGQLLTFGAGPQGRPLSGSLAVRPSWGKVTSIKAGLQFTLALTDNGTLLAWGANDGGQLGVGDTTLRATPTVVRFPSHAGRIVDYYAGDESAVAITSTNDVYAWGRADLGQAGQGRTTKNPTRPSQVIRLDGAGPKRVFGGAHHVLVTVSHGPAVRLRVSPQKATVRPNQHVTYRVDGVDAFGNDLGPAEHLDLGRITLRVNGGEAVGLTARAATAGTHFVTARAGRLTGGAALVVKNGH